MILFTLQSTLILIDLHIGKIIANNFDENQERLKSNRWDGFRIGVICALSYRTVGDLDIKGVGRFINIKCDVRISLITRTLSMLLASGYSRTVNKTIMQSFIYTHTINRTCYWQ